MRLSDFLLDIGRPVAFYPKLRHVTGSSNATLFLCQLIYWCGKGADPDGWIWKVSDEITEETGLTYEEQVTARKHLRERGLIEEHHARLEHRLYFRVKFDVLNDAWDAFTKATEPPNPDTPTGPTPVPETVVARSESYTETTSESTACMREPAHTPKPPKPSQSPKPKREPTPIPPAVNTFREETNRFPRKEWWNDIEHIIGADETNLKVWRKLVHDWLGLGWSPMNVKGMLDAYRNGGIKLRNGAPEPSEPASFAAIREYERMRAAGELPEDLFA